MMCTFSMGIPYRDYANFPKENNLHAKALAIIITISSSFFFFFFNSVSQCAKYKVFPFLPRQALLKEFTAEKPHPSYPKQIK